MDAGQQSWLVGWFHGRCEMMKENGPPPHRFFSNSHANALCSDRCVARVVFCVAFCLIRMYPTVWSSRFI